LGDIIGIIIGIIVGVATGNPALGVAAYCAVSAGISAYQAGGNFLQVAGISIVASIAGYYGATFGGWFGGWVGGGSFGAAVFGGMFGGAASGAVYSALTGGDVLRETLLGGGIGTGKGIMIGGFTYTKPPQSQISSSGSQDNPNTTEAIKSGDIQGAQDTEANSSNQPRYLAQKVTAEKIADAATKGSVGVGNNPNVASEKGTSKIPDWLWKVYKGLKTVDSWLSSLSGEEHHTLEDIFWEYYDYRFDADGPVLGEKKEFTTNDKRVIEVLYDILKKWIQDPGWLFGNE